MNPKYTNGMPGRDWDIINTTLNSSVIDEIEQDILNLLVYFKTHNETGTDTWLFKVGGFIMLSDDSVNEFMTFFEKMKNSGSWILHVTASFVATVKRTALNSMLAAFGSQGEKEVFANNLKEGNIRPAQSQRERDVMLTLIDIMPMYFDLSTAGLDKYVGVQNEGSADEAGYDLILTGYDEAAKLKVIKIVKESLQCGLGEAKELVLRTPSTLLYSYPRHIAEQISKEIKANGGETNIVPSGSSVDSASTACGYDVDMDRFENPSVTVSSNISDSSNNVNIVINQSSNNLPAPEIGKLAEIQKMFAAHAAQLKPQSFDILTTKEPVIFTKEQMSADISIEDFADAKAAYDRRLKNEKKNFDAAEREYNAIKSNKDRERERRRKEKKEKKEKNKKLLKKIATVGIVGSVILWLIFGVIYPKLIYPNMANDDFNTPEIVQTYSGTYKSSSTEGNAIITISSCDASGNVKGYFEFMVDDAYGKYEISGTIDSKKNNGNLKLTVTPGQWIVQPSYYSQLDTMEIEIFDNYQSLRCYKYDMEWAAGENDEYLIKTADDLKKLSGSNASFQLKNDIDLAGINWTPIEEFSGILLGNGYTIKGLTINAACDNVGLFSKSNCVVKDLSLEDVNISVSGRCENIGALCGNFNGSAINVSVSGVVDAPKCTNVGGLFGHCYENGATLSNLTNSASVYALSKAAGIIGRADFEYNTVTLQSLCNSGEIIATEDYSGGIIGIKERKGGMDTCDLLMYDCENTGNIKGRYYVGGIIGCGYVGSIEDSICKANIEGEASVGCIAGEAANMTIKNCENKGSTLKATGFMTVDDKKRACVGGFVGKGCSIIDCTNEVEIVYSGGGEFVGGIVGYAYLDASDEILTLKNVSNNTSVSGANYVGGICGYLFNEYGSVQVEAATNNANVYGSGDYIGGVVGMIKGDDYANIFDSTNNADVEGNNYVGGILGYGKANSKDSEISNTSSSGTVTGDAYTGDIAGELNNVTVN